ncbi:MAG: hypothetical protein RMJ14_06080 [Nitrososphaerota archaeon]|nr:hypothetical protein [Aigarchaeota archaeon]MDW8077180.1 hypothetical protein [Nitrososphaerota archaeon]
MVKARKKKGKATKRKTKRKIPAKKKAKKVTPAPAEGAPPVTEEKPAAGTTPAEEGQEKPSQ